MSISLCKICLVTGDIKMYSIENSRLQEIYEHLSNTKLKPGDIKPVILCYICCSLLERYIKFSKMSQRAEKTITDLVNNGMEVTHPLLIMLNLGMTHLNVTPMNLLSINADYKNKEVTVKKEILDEDEENVTVVTKVVDLSHSVCRVCLAGHARTYCIEAIGLENIFEKVTSTKLNTEDGRPVTICYICLAQLKKCLRVSEMCEIAKKLLSNNNHGGEMKLIIALRLNLQMVHNVGVETTQFPSQKTFKTDLVPVKTEYPENTKEIAEPAKDKKIVITYTSGSDHVCHVCSKKYKTETGLVKHLQSHGIEKQFSCKRCEKTFNTIINLRKHLKIHGKYHTCYQCSKSFKSRETFQSHMRVHGDNQFACKICHKILSGNMSLQRHMSTHSAVMPYKCDICHRSFADPYQLKRHLIRHTGIKPFNCKICGKGYFDNNNYQIHVRSHTGEKPYECERCGRKFTDLSCKTRHMKIHSGLRPYACNHCSMAFLRKSVLILHLRTHTGIKPYSCTQCSMSYYSNSRLYRHLKIHNEALSFKCTVCDNLFLNQRGLKRHMKTHKEFKPEYICDKCNKSFSRYSGIVVHLRVHTGEKPYACNKCDMRYSTQTARLRHQRTHEGKLYACNLCDKRYSRKSGLQNHINKKHTK